MATESSRTIFPFLHDRARAFHDLKALLETEELADLGPKPRRSAFTIPELDKRLSAATQDITITPALKELIQALIYLWHDHLDESHHIAQDIETADGSLIHAIMHRREPDYSNAKYWFRRVGSHPSFLALSHRAGQLLDHHAESDLHSRLVPNKMWDSFAFVDAVEDGAKGEFRSKVPLLEQLQKIEFECLLENIVNRV